jgi:uncharacterized delta-60 repeat protein
VSTDFLTRCTPLCALALLVYLCNGIANGTPGQPGTLDSTWASTSPGSAGKLLTEFPGGGGIATSIVLQPDGKAVLAGSCASPGTSGFCAVRYNADGSLDSTFGNGGKFQMNLGTGANAVALQQDGKPVLAGTCFNGTTDDFCAVRLLANGTLDTTFGVSGQVITAIGDASDQVRAIALQADGKLLLAGDCYGGVNTDFCIARYNGDGSLDQGFGVGGKVISAISAGNSQARAIAVQPDGNIVVAGYCGIPGVNDFCTARYLSNGSLDPTFGTQGKVIATIVPTAYNVAYSVALQPDGKLVLAGYCARLCALRYNTNGTLDTSFGINGTLTSGDPPDGPSQARAIGIEPDGKIIIAGECYASATNTNITRACALRYNPDGSPDMSFGDAGKASLPASAGADNLYALALQRDGKILMAGGCTVGQSWYFCSARFEGGPFGYKYCSLDIDNDGRVLAMTDSLIHARIALGLTGSAVVNGISFPTEATRKTWPAIREYLVTQCGMSLVL